MRRSVEDILRVFEDSEKLPSRGTVRSHYLRWREARGLTSRCDNQSCKFLGQELIWNDLKLDLILDHKFGNSKDNRPENLRFLCPNCDSQNTKTKGGANAGRIERLKGGSYHVRNRDGTQDAHTSSALIVVAVSFEAGAVDAMQAQGGKAQAGD